VIAGVEAASRNIRNPLKAKSCAFKMANSCGKINKSSRRKYIVLEERLGA